MGEHEQSVQTTPLDSETLASWDAAKSDMQAILSSFGIVALMVTQIERSARNGIQLATAPDGATVKMGKDFVRESAVALKEAREQIGQVLEHLGDFQNNRDTVSGTSEAVGKPVYEAFHKRCEGITLDD